MVVQTQAAKLVYRFSEGDDSMADLLGGKGSNLCEMTKLGLPVPPGFVISTQVCRDYLSNGYALPDGLEETIRDRIGELEQSIGHRFGVADNPLLVSVPLRRPHLHARHDGHHPQPWHQRRNRRGPGQDDGRPPPSLRRLPPLRPDIRRGGAGSRVHAVRGVSGGTQGPGPASSWTTN